MNAPAVDLLLRIARAEAGGRKCPECGRSLSSARMAVNDQAADHFVLDVACRCCRHVMQVEIRPDGDAGVAAVR